MNLKYYNFKILNLHYFHTYASLVYRFVILKYVRRDLIHTLPLPKPLQDYLNTPHYYFEPPDRSGHASTGPNSHHDNPPTPPARVG